MNYQWLIIQDGALPLSPDGILSTIEHVCTSTVIWPCDAKLSPSNSVIVDPCFSAHGIQLAESRLDAIGGTLSSIGHYFETHQHDDHLLRIPNETGLRSLFSKRNPARSWKVFSLNDRPSLPGIRLIPCSGHATDLEALAFRGPQDEEVWVVADAVLNRKWLTSWGYYWPNVYEPDEIVQTWRTVASILRSADVVVPGHGPPIYVDAVLLEELAENFCMAEFSERCEDVLTDIHRRIASFASGTNGSAGHGRGGLG